MASARDAKAVAGVLTDCARYLDRLGVTGAWPIPFPESDVVESIRAGETYVVEAGRGEVAATFRLAWADDAYWGPQPRTSGYLHKLGVGRAFAHRGLGKAAISWAEGEARSRGKRVMRLDCLAADPFIVGYYRDLGYGTVRTIKMPGNRAVALVLMEKDLRAAARLLRL